MRHNLYSFFGRYSFAKLFVSTFCKMDIKTFIFLDCETTGLPSFEYNRTKITEIAFTIVESNHISLGVYPRVQNKLSLSFNPCKLIDPYATQITGLSNDSLEFQRMFDYETVELIKSFLGVYKKPQCFVAHNGFRFDYPILHAEVLKSNNNLPDDLLCVDTLQIFRELHEENETLISEQKVSLNDVEIENDIYNYREIEVAGGCEAQKRNETTPKKPKIKRIKSEEIDNLYFNPGNLQFQNTTSTNIVSAKKKLVFPKPSFKLVDCYKRFTNKEPKNAHRAEVDVDMLVECAATLGQRFVNLANQNFKLFTDIPPMTIGKKIGI